jgi:hypothetical protein
MFKSFPMRVAGLALVLAAAAGCSSKKAPIYEHENFDDSGTFSRNYPVTDAQTCEAARRALLSQGYIITSSDPKLVSGHKSFQQTGESHMEISFSVVCADDGSEGRHATMFANALQDRYALKKTNNSASVGVGVLGSVSMPIVRRLDGQGCQRNRIVAQVLRAFLHIGRVVPASGSEKGRAHQG